MHQIYVLNEGRFVVVVHCSGSSGSSGVRKQYTGYNGNQPKGEMMNVAKFKYWVRKNHVELATVFAISGMAAITIVAVHVMTNGNGDRYPFATIPQKFNEEQQALFDKMVDAARALDKAIAESPTES